MKSKFVGLKLGSAKPFGKRPLGGAFAKKEASASAAPAGDAAEASKEGRQFRLSVKIEDRQKSLRVNTCWSYEELKVAILKEFGQSKKLTIESITMQAKKREAYCDEQDGPRKKDEQEDDDDDEEDITNPAKLKENKLLVCEVSKNDDDESTQETKSESPPPKPAAVKQVAKPPATGGASTKQEGGLKGLNSLAGGLKSKLLQGGKKNAEPKAEGMIQHTLASNATGLKTDAGAGPQEEEEKLSNSPRRHRMTTGGRPKKLPPKSPQKLDNISKMKILQDQQQSAQQAHQVREVDFKMLESLLIKETVCEYNRLVGVVNTLWAKRLGFTMKQVRPPKWNQSKIGTLRIYCSKHKNGLKPAEDNCQFGITFRLDPECLGKFWVVGEVYNPSKMCHTHDLDYVSPIVQPEKVNQYYEEEKIDSDDESYGDEAMKFHDEDSQEEGPSAESERIDLIKESPISDEFSQQYKLVDREQYSTMASRNEIAQPMNSAAEQPGATKLQSYVETYKQMIEKINQYDSVIEKKGTTKGKTLDLSRGSKTRRHYSSKKKPGEHREGLPRHISEYGQFIHQLAKIQKAEDEQGKASYINAQEQAERHGWFENMFFASSAMIENYLTYRDIVFINKRLIKTRFCRHLVLLCGITSNGKNCLFGMGLITREDEDSLRFIFDQFNKAMVRVLPKLFIVEKSSPFKSMISKMYPEAKVLYCSYHYQRCIRHYFENTKKSQQKYQLKAQEFLDPLPLLDEAKEFDTRIQYLRAHQTELANGGDKLNMLLEKIGNERHYWSKVAHLGYFTGQFNFCDRNESVKVRMNDILGDTKMSVSDAARLIAKAECFSSVKLEQFDEWRKVNLQSFENLPFFDDYLSTNFSDYAQCKIRYSAALALQNWRLAKEKDGIYLLEPKQAGEDEVDESEFDKYGEKQKWWKLKVINQIVYCTCMEYFSTGLPCQHQLLLLIVKHLKVPIHPRWAKDFFSVLADLEHCSRNERIDKLLEQNYWEQKYFFEFTSKQSVATKNLKETANQIRKLKDKVEIYKEDCRLNGIPDHFRRSSSPTQRPPSPPKMSKMMSQASSGKLKMGNKLGEKKRPLISSEGDLRMGQNALIELSLAKPEKMTETLPKIDEDLDAQITIFKREPCFHEMRSFEVKFEYGFRENTKIQKLKGGKIVKKREKKEVVDVGASSKPKLKRDRKDKKEKKPKEESEEEEPEKEEKVIIKIQTEDLLKQMADAQSTKGKTKSITELIAERHAKIQKDIEAGIIQPPKQKKIKKSQTSKMSKLSRGDDGAPEGVECVEGANPEEAGKEATKKVRKKRVQTLTQQNGDPSSAISNLVDPASANPNSADPNSIPPSGTLTGGPDKPKKKRERKAKDKSQSCNSGVEVKILSKPNKRKKTSDKPNSEVGPLPSGDAQGNSEVPKQPEPVGDLVGLAQEELREVEDQIIKDEES